MVSHHALAAIEAANRIQSMVFQHETSCSGLTKGEADTYISQKPSTHTIRIDLMKHVTDASFETDVLKASGAVLVDFWAEWCGPCKQLAPALDDLSKELGDKITVTKVNIDDNPATPGKYGVRGIPTLIIFKDGQVVATKVGALPKSKLFEWVQSSI